MPNPMNHEAIHNTPPQLLSLDDTRDKASILTDPEKRNQHLNWLERNDPLFHNIMWHLWRLGATDGDYEAAVVVYAGLCRQLLNEKGAASPFPFPAATE